MYIFEPAFLTTSQILITLCLLLKACPSVGILIKKVKILWGCTDIVFILRLHQMTCSICPFLMNWRTTLAMT